MSRSFPPTGWVGRLPFRALGAVVAGLVTYVTVRLLLDAGWLGASDVAQTVLHRVVLIAWAVAVGLAYHADRSRRNGKPKRPDDAEERELTTV